MVKEQLICRGIKGQKILDAFRKIERHRFVPDIFGPQAYSDCPLSIGENQTISQPYIVAYMLEALSLEGNEKVLEIGTGSGYQTALLSLLAREIYSIERSKILAQRAKEVLAELSLDNNIQVIVGDGTKGWPKDMPYNAIIVSAAAPSVPQPLIEQLAPGGRMIIPVGERFSQVLVRITKIKDTINQEILESCVFVPLVGEFGWGSEDV